MNSWVFNMLYFKLCVIFVAYICPSLTNRRLFNLYLLFFYCFLSDVSRYSRFSLYLSCLKTRIYHLFIQGALVAFSIIDIESTSCFHFSELTIASRPFQWTEAWEKHHDFIYLFLNK